MKKAERYEIRAALLAAALDAPEYYAPSRAPFKYTHGTLILTCDNDHDSIVHMADKFKKAPYTGKNPTRTPRRWK